jgi:Bacterial Ig domain
MNRRGAVRIARIKPKIALLITIFLLSASGSLATCGCKEKIGESNVPVEKVDLKIQQQLNGEDVSEKPFVVNVTPIIPHMQLKFVRPEYGEVFMADEMSNTADIDLVAATAWSRPKCDDTDCDFLSVEFFEDSNLIAKVSEPEFVSKDYCLNLWSHEWDNVSPGTYKLTARAINCKNQTETSGQVMITVKKNNSLPKVIMTNPYEGQIFSYKEPITITSYAWDNDNNVTKVEIFEGLNKIDENSTGCKKTENCSFDFIWTPSNPSIYSLKAFAVDEEGAVGSSSPITINVKPEKLNQKDETESSGQIRDSADCTFIAPPGKADLISPNGTIGTDKPTFTWSLVPDSTSYELTAKGELNGYNESYEIKDLNLACSDISCSVNPFDSDSWPDLSRGQRYNWWIQTNNCKASGPRSSNMSFKVTNQPPQEPVAIAPNGLISTNTPSFIWSSVPESTKYRLRVKNEADQILVDETYEAEDVTSGYNCSTISPRSLSNNGVFFWKVKAKNDFGDNSDWSDELYFETVCASPKDSASQIGEYIENLSDQAFDANSDRRKSKLIETLDEVKERIDSKDYQKAINRLDGVVRKRADGSVDGNKDDDWIVDTESQRKICEMIDDLIENLKTAKDTN